MRKVALCALALVLALAGVAQAQDLDEVLENYYEAMGGLDAIKAVDNVQMTGRLNLGQAGEAPVKMIQAREHKVRIEFTMQGMTGIQAYDGESGWMLMPFMGQTAPEPMTQEMSDQTKKQADIDGPLVDAEAKGIALELIGKEDVEGTEAYHIAVTHPDGSMDHYFLDAEYFIPIQTKSKATIQGQEIETTSTLGDYKEVAGVLFAHSIEQSGGMGMMNIIIDNIDVNADVDEAIFAMPEAEEPAEDTQSEG